MTTTEFKKGDKVETRVGGQVGTIVDRENEAVRGWAFQVRFADGVTKWLRSTDLRFAN